MNSKGNHKVKRQPSEWEKIIANETTDKGLISKIYKQLIQCQENKQPTQKVVERPKQTFLQRRHTVEIGRAHSELQLLHLYKWVEQDLLLTQNGLKS